MTHAHSWLQEVFNSADEDSSGTLEEEKVIKLIKELNTGLATIKVKQKLKVSTIKVKQKLKVSTNKVKQKLKVSTN